MSALSKKSPGNENTFALANDQKESKNSRSKQLL